jgi:hypothetical protein
MTVSIYSPLVRREALLWGITDLQAYRRVNARRELERRDVRRYDPERITIID